MLTRQWFLRHNLLTLELVLAVARAGSMTRGAAQMQLALAAASKRLSDLEADLGHKLFVRKARGVVPTDLCRALLKHIEGACGALQAIDSEGAKSSSRLRGLVKIGIAREMPHGRWLHEIAAFSRYHEAVEVQVSVQSSAEVEAALTTGDLHLGLFIQSRNCSGLECVPISAGRWVVLVPAGHALTRRDIPTIKDVLEFDLIGCDCMHPLIGKLSEAARHSGTFPRQRVHTADMNAIASLLEAGAGVAFVTDEFAERLKMSHDVASVGVLWEWAPYNFVMGMARRQIRSTALSALAEQLLQTVRRAPSMSAANDTRGAACLQA